MATDTDGPREFAFEVSLCSHLEQTTDWVLGRQLGAAVDAPGRRIIDVCGVVPGPAFDRRARITDRTIPPRAVESDAGVGEATFWRDAFDCHRETAREVVDRAVEAGFFTTEWRGRREYVRKTTRYPDDWFARLVGVENKPDLGDPGELERQLRTDVSLGLFDEVVLATESYVTRAHLNRIPAEVGVWRFDPETGERRVVRDPAPLPVDAPGVELVAERALRTDVAVVSAAEKRRARRRLAERTYGKGWRTYAFPACANARATDDGRPYCAAFDCVVDPARDCGGDCGAFEAGDAPAVDTDALRDERTPWVADPAGVARRQTGLDRFS
ncbi:DUF5787 family protein [Halogeometricum limi]|uniref:Uncharacterized protein n=1 Tax=Halogeometricum limi TaxID=555875 RepID=A0A1I6H788_9EURY|nr:DUF5787 family protein [Halogeometricum limi]SFR50343.1 hypothetical protein SAMN04488124_1872 [Halogeometricum limi]